MPCEFTSFLYLCGRKQYFDMRVVPPKFIQRLFPDIIWRIDDEDGIYITFDDGPTPGVTEWILATLRKYDAKATFFVLGKNVELYPDLYEKICQEGHRIGNHTYSHQKGWRMACERYIEDIDFASDIVHSNLFRPPYARITPSQIGLVAQRYKIVLWSILSFDYKRNLSCLTCARAVTRDIRGGDIILFHDSDKSFKNMCFALPRLLDKAKELGLRCKAIEL